MPPKRKRLKGALADCTQFVLKLTSVASDGIPVPGLKGATGGASLVWDKVEIRKSNIVDERQARSRGKRLQDQLIILEDGQLEPEQVAAIRQKLVLCMDQLPDIPRTSIFEQLISVDKNARDIAACLTGLDRLNHEIELALVSKILSASRTIQANQTSHEEALHDVAQSQEALKHEVRATREASESQATLQLQNIKNLNRDLRLFLAAQIFLFRLVG